MRKIRVALINDTYVKIGPYTKKGSEIFGYNYITAMQKFQKKTCKITSFCSGNSPISVPKQSVMYHSSTEDKYIGDKYNHLFAMLLTAKAAAMQNRFDVFHVSNGNGEYIIPFARFIRKPIVVTMHGTTFDEFRKKYLLAAEVPSNVHFVSISNSQRTFQPKLNYLKTIYHGIDTQGKFVFDSEGGNTMLWTGRAVPEKGLDIVLQVAKKTKKRAKIFPIIKHEYIEWLHEEIIKKRDVINQITQIQLDFDVTQASLAREYQLAKLFLFPLRWEEPFGLTVAESLACGTPVVAYACGSMPELIQDGKTGYLINPSDSDRRGDWIIKKTGIEGLCEAVQRIYALPPDEYRAMRLQCRTHAENSFSAEKMVQQYVTVYQSLLTKKKSSSL